MALMMNGKPVVVAGGNRAGPIAINSGAGAGRATVFGGLSTQDALRPNAQPVPPPTSLPAPMAPPVAAQRQEFAPQPMPVLKQAPQPQAPPSAPAPQSVPGTFGPGNTLINKQIAPSSTGPNQYDTQAAQYLQGAKIDDYSQQTNQARDMILKQLQGLQDAPDRFKLAQSNYDLFQKDSEPAYQQQLRGVGQKAAALGRVGAGMTTNDLTGALGQHQNLLSGERQRLINTAQDATQQDRLNIQNALQSAGGLLGGQDFALNQARGNLALGQAGGFTGLGQNQANREATAVGQQMQQQQYQSGLDQQNIQNQIAQQQLQQGAQQQAWNQNFQQQSLAGNQDIARQQILAQLAGQQNTNYPSPYGGSGISSSQLGFGG